MNREHACPHYQPGVGCAQCGVRNLSVCGALAPDELATLEAIAATACFAARQTLFIQGEAAQSVYNITQGVVRLYKLLPDGRRQIVGFALPGDFLGLALGETFGCSADAVDAVTACRFSRTAYAAFVESHPRLLRRMHDFATHELAIAQNQMMLLGRRTAEEKLVTFLLDLRERWARLNEGHPSPTVQLPMSRQDIADYLGLTIETVSRTFTKLAREKTIVIVPDGVRLTDIDRMTALAAA